MQPRRMRPLLLRLRDAVARGFGRRAPAVRPTLWDRAAVGGDGASMARPRGPAPPARAGAGASRGQRVCWEVRSGEHFRSIAEAALREALGRAPTEAELVPFWRTLVDQNRGVLADPENPELLFPGQVLVVPPISRPAANAS